MSLLLNQMFISFAILLMLDKVMSNDLQLDQIVNLKNTGGIGCLLVIHTDIEQCKAQYTQRVTTVRDEGHTMDTTEYRKAYCCGFWTLRDCVADSSRSKCDRNSAKTISNMKIYNSEHENILQKNCNGFEYGSKQCGTASIKSISVWTLISALIISFLLKR